MSVMLKSMATGAGLAANKMQQATNECDGGIKLELQQQQKQQQQTDLVIKSHELIKQKFFEQLERRESIKKSTKSTKPPVQPSQMLTDQPAAQIAQLACLEAECLQTSAPALAATTIDGPEGEIEEQQVDKINNEPQYACLSNTRAADESCVRLVQTVAGEPASVCDGDACDSDRAKTTEVEDEADVLKVSADSKRADVGQADLIILPPKFINQRARVAANASQLRPAGIATSRQDDRLTRRSNRRQSRKLKTMRASRLLDECGPRLHSDCSCCSSSSASDLRTTFADLEPFADDLGAVGRRAESHKLVASDSLSEELESLVSRSISDEQDDSTAYQKDKSSPTRGERQLVRTNSIELHHRRSQAAAHQRGAHLRGVPSSRRQCIDIDCVSPKRTVEWSINSKNNCPSNEKSPRSLPVLVHLFRGASKSSQPSRNAATVAAATTTTTPTTPSTNSSSAAGWQAREQVYDEPRRLRQQESIVDCSSQPTSGFWSFSAKTLIGHSHGSRSSGAGHKSAGSSQRSSSLDPDRVSNANRGYSNKENRKWRTSANADANVNSNDANNNAIGKGKASKVKQQQQAHQIDHEQQYANLKPLAAGYTRLDCEQKRHQEESNKSLNLCQSLWQTYAKRRHRCGHSSSHRFYSHRRSSASLSRCSKFECNRSSSSSGCSADPEASSQHQEAAVWGQLTKINKSDGSQTIELRRCPSRPWGFFVARGSIGNARGIFISRWHDEQTKSSLAGLLSVGDRILAIDHLAIDLELPDCDILRLNQLISKKSKVLLKVKPFKG